MANKCCVSCKKSPMKRTYKRKYTGKKRYTKRPAMLSQVKKALTALSETKSIGSELSTTETLSGGSAANWSFNVSLPSAIAQGTGPNERVGLRVHKKYYQNHLHLTNLTIWPILARVMVVKRNANATGTQGNGDFMNLLGTPENFDHTDPTQSRMKLSKDHGTILFDKVIAIPPGLINSGAQVTSGLSSRFINAFVPVNRKDYFGQQLSLPNSSALNDYEMRTYLFSTFNLTAATDPGDIHVKFATKLSFVDI